MTRSGERNALEPDLVPVHQRVRDLCGRFPEGRLPAAEVKALRESIETPRPGGSALFPRRNTATRMEFEAFKRELDTATSELAEMLRAAAAGETELQHLSERLRGLHDHQRLRFDPESLELGLAPGQVRAIARHLLDTGTTGTEVMTGLQLMRVAAEAADAERLSDLALLGRVYGVIASGALWRLEYPVNKQFALAMRAPDADRWALQGALVEASLADIDALAATRPVGDVIRLLRMYDGVQGIPRWLKGNQRLAAAVAAAAEHPHLMEADAETPFAMAWLYDEIRYGRCALLGYSPGQRERSIERISAWFGSDRALQAVESVVARRPSDGRAIWLHRKVIEARREPAGGFPAGLAVRFQVPQPGQEVRTHLLIGGMPLLPRVFELGVPSTPERFFHRTDGLRATATPRAVQLAQAACGEGCCGELRAEVRRNSAAGRVEWEIWRTRHAHGRRERIVFDGAAYDARSPAPQVISRGSGRRGALPGCCGSGWRPNRGCWRGGGVASVASTLGAASGRC